MNIRQVYWHNMDHTTMGDDPFLYCPMCGEHLVQKVLGHQPRQVCPGCGYIHFRNPAPTVSLVIIKEGQILLGKRTSNLGKELWATPSGYIEFKEDFLSTATREAKEETGLDIEIRSILNVTDSFFPPDQHFLNIYLLAHVRGGRLQAGDDMEELGWFPLNGPFPEMAFEEDVDMIARYRQLSRESLPVEKGNPKG